MGKKKIFILENGMELEVKNTRDIQRICGNSCLFFLKELPKEPIFASKIANIFSKNLRIKSKK